MAWPNIVFLIISAVYAFELIYTEIKGEELNNDVFLGPPLSVLDDFGALNPYKERYEW